MCQDFRLMPGELSRPDFIALFKQANQGCVAVGPQFSVLQWREAHCGCGVSSKVNNSGDPEPLTYPHFVELLGLVAVNLIHDDNQCPTALSKLHMLFFTMHETAGQFTGEELKLVRNVTRAVKKHLSELKQAETQATRGRRAELQSTVQDVLQEEVYG